MKGRYHNMSEDKKAVQNVGLTQSEEAKVAGGISTDYIAEQDILNKIGSIEKQNPEFLPHGGPTHN